MKQRWCLEEENKMEESRDGEEGFEDGSGETQEEGTLSFASCQYNSLINKIFLFSVI